MKHLTHHQFSASMDGVLQAVPARLMESHLATCVDCRGRWDGFVATQRAIADLMRHDGTPEFQATLVETLERAASPGDEEVAPAEEKPVTAKAASGRHMTHHQLSACLDGELIGVSAQLVERHLAGCDACRRRWEGFRDARGTLVELLGHAADAEFERELERILGEIATKGAAPPWRESASAPPRPIPARPSTPAEPPVARAPDRTPEPAAGVPPVIERHPPPRPEPVRVVIEAAPAGPPARVPPPVIVPRPPAITQAPRPVARDRRPVPRGEDAALSRVWMVTAFLVLAAVVWISWMLWDYHRSAALRPATVPATATTTPPARGDAVTTAPARSAESVVPSPAATGAAVVPKDSIAPASPAPMTRHEQAPRVEAPPVPRGSAPAPTRVLPAVAATPHRPARPKAKPAVPAPAPALATPAAPQASSTPKKAAAAPVLGLLCGHVTDESHQPVVGARVLLADLQVPVATDRNGGFCVSAPLGERTVSIVALGFETSRQVVVVTTQTLEILVTLRSSAPVSTPPDPH